MTERDTDPMVTITRALTDAKARADEAREWQNHAEWYAEQARELSTVAHQHLTPEEGGSNAQ